MNIEPEIINFPIKRLFLIKDSDRVENSLRAGDDEGEEDKKLNDGEWEQEYYLIYNSYTLENV
jgi:hypothetical protein